MFGRNGHIGRAQQRVGAGGEDFQGAAAVGKREADLKPLRAPDPVALHGLDRLRPLVHAIQLIEQLVGIGGDAQEPLWDLTTLYRRAGAPATAVDDLLIGEHGLIDRIPVHHRRGAVDQALLVELGEEPLLPAVVLGVTGGELTAPVVGKAQALQLAAHVVDVRARPTCRRHIVLDGGILGRQPESVPAHGLQHVLTLHALIAGNHITDGVVAHMAHVQPPARVGKHAQAIEFFPCLVLADFERLLVMPAALHDGLDARRFVTLGEEVALEFFAHSLSALIAWKSDGSPGQPLHRARGALSARVGFAGPMSIQEAHFSRKKAAGSDPNRPSLGAPRRVLRRSFKGRWRRSRVRDSCRGSPRRYP